MPIIMGAPPLKMYLRTKTAFAAHAESSELTSGPKSYNTACVFVHSHNSDNDYNDDNDNDDYDDENDDDDNIEDDLRRRFERSERNPNLSLIFKCIWCNQCDGKSKVVKGVRTTNRLVSPVRTKQFTKFYL
ncbi:hypothetical protein M0802_005222 [Mischocyttarus mexicanus]|nr:hypothetical protein M0802_005222 [Mischocyttarus mexicanus]